MPTNFEEKVYAFISQLKDFEYAIQSIDKIWQFIFPHKQTVYRISVVKYQETFYIHHVDGRLCSLEVQLNKSIQAAPSFGYSHDDGRYHPEQKWRSSSQRLIDGSWWCRRIRIKSNRQVISAYPLNRRYGIVQNAIVRAVLPNLFRIDKELGSANTKKFIKLVEAGLTRRHEATLASMTANDFFNYCKIAYIGGQRKDDSIDEELSGREMYKRYADGRHEGLLDIAGDSPEEFASWIDGKHPKKETGGHPWEIKRGGNTTHIDLSVSRPMYSKEGFIVTLRGASFTRLNEAIRMFLAIHDVGLPILIDDPEGIRKRLLGQDHIGIVPSYDALHRANQHFHLHESVYDVMHYDELGRYKRSVLPFITWEPLPILKPMKT